MAFRVITRTLPWSMLTISMLALSGFAPRLAHAQSSSPPAAPAAEAPVSAAWAAHHRALEALKLAATAPLSTARLSAGIAAAEAKISDGRRDEAIFDLVYLVESPRFGVFADSDEGRGCVFLLGDALRQAGAVEPATDYLRRLLSRTPGDVWSRRAAQSLVDLGLEADRMRAVLTLLDQHAANIPAEARADIEYLRGRALSRESQPEQALAAYSRVKATSRFWGQANYLAGLIEVERGRLREGERLFCKVADPKQTPRQAAVFGGSDFFQVRDLARLGLGRVAHEQYRFDDARYYYHLVPNDSERLPEALYETATTRYEAKDYSAARTAMDDLKRLERDHAYADEAYILDAYIDLAECRFPSADRKLSEFLARYQPARDAARRLMNDGAAMRRFVNSVRDAADPATAGLGVAPATARALAAVLRVDDDYRRISRRYAALSHQVAGLRGTLSALDELSRKLAAGERPAPTQAAPRLLGNRDKLGEARSELAELRRLIREAEQAGKAKSAELTELSAQVESLELSLRSLHVPEATSASPGAPPSNDLEKLVREDRALASTLYQRAEAQRRSLEEQQIVLAKSAFTRLDKRLTRLVNRARLGRIETVLGKKRSLEIEVEALSQGLLPRSIVDSLSAERYLGDAEEYWPFDGEDWEDEYVGGEGLR